MKTIRVVANVAMGVFVLGAAAVGCGGEVPGEEISTIVRAATSVTPSSLSFSRAVIPATEPLRSVAFGNGKFVAVGSNATVEISGDGVQWTQAIIPVSEVSGDIRSIVYSDRTHLFYILVTDPSLVTQRLHSSPDGKRWTLLSSLALVGPAKLSLANDQFFASGHDSATGAGTVYASPDARTWTRSPTVLANGAFFDEVAFGANRYVAHASDEDGNSSAWLSFDGSTWQLTEGFGQGGSGIAFGAGKFVAGRDRRLESSPDGITWTDSLDTDDANFGTLLYSGGFRAFDTGGRIWVSPDAVTWTQTAGASVASVIDVAVSAGRYVAVGGGGSLATTTTLTAWTPVNPPGGVSYTTITFGSGKFVMGDRGRVQTSTDAVTWKTVVPLVSDRTYRRIKRVQNAFFAIYTCGGGDDCIADSSDGINWLHSYSFSEEKPRDITYGNGKYVFVQTHGRISNFTSFCCLSTWNNSVFELPSGEAFVAVAFGAGKFVAVTASGQVVTSTDGTNWEAHTDAGLSGVTSLVFGKGVFVAATASGVFSSASGTSFTRVFTPPAGAVNNQVSFANQLFFYTGDAGFLASSADGNAWTVVPSATTDTIYQVAFGNALYVAGGDHNTIVSSK